MSIWLTQMHLWVFLICLLAPTNALAQPNSDRQVQSPEVAPAPPPKIVSPKLGSVEKPASTYKLDDIILYQVKVVWPEPPTDVRMISPEMNLENLELVGVGQETVSVPGKNTEAQILTLRFKPQKSGPAKINSLTLQWTQAAGAASSSLRIPAVEFEIKNKPNFRFWFLLGIGPLFIGLFGFGFMIFRKRKKSGQAQPEKSLEETYLAQFDGLQNSKSLNDLSHLLEHYLQQKIDWNRTQEDYNDLQKKAEQTWGKKEAQEVKGFFEKISYYRFSGSSSNQQELIDLFQQVRSFIERKKVI